MAMVPVGMETRVVSDRGATSRSVQACVPMPIQIVIDDVGWWSGLDGHARGEPFRTGIARAHTRDDYQAIVDLGTALGMRPQAALVLCEWDRENLLRGVPTATWMGEAWDNAPWVGPWLDEAADLISANQSHLEVAVHGVGHEYWIDGAMTRAEWYDRDGLMRPYDQVMAHLDAWYTLLRQNGLDLTPTSFVPAAFLHTFGDGARGLDAILEDRGIDYVSTPFSGMTRRRQTEGPLFGIDEGVFVADRGDGQVPWDAIASDPPREIAGPILGLHWPNILHPDPSRNGEVVERWVRAVRSWGSRLDRVLARDTDAFRTQLAYHVGSQVSVQDQTIVCHLSSVLRKSVPGDGGMFTMKVRSPRGTTFACQHATIERSYWEDASRAHVLVVRALPGRRRLQIRADSQVSGTRDQDVGAA